MRRNNNTVLLIIMLLTGAIIGGLLGQVLGGYLPILTSHKIYGLQPTTIDLGIVSFTVGFLLRLNLAGVIGLLFGYFLYRQM